MGTASCHMDELAGQRYRLARKIRSIPWVFGEIARKITEGETLRIIVNGPAHEGRARRVLERAGVDLTCVEFFRWPTNRGWTRDMGPLFVRSATGGRTSILRFRFNAWAKYPDWKKDDAVPARAARALKKEIIPAIHNDREIVLEGGSIDVNGRGSLLTTEECLLHPTLQIRNPGFTKTDYQNLFRSYLGATNVIWLKDGIAGDDTHGHVDDLCRFVNARTVVMVQETEPCGCEPSCLPGKLRTPEGCAPGRRYRTGCHSPPDAIPAVL